MGGFREGFNNSLMGLAHVQEQADIGTQRRKQNTLQELAGQYYGGQDQSQAMVGKFAAAGGDPRGMLQHGQDQDKQKRDNLSRMAGLLVKAPPQMRQQIYASQVLPFLRSEQLDAPEQWSDDMIPMAQQLEGLSQNGQPASLQEFQAMTSGMSAEDVAKAKRISLGLDGRASSGLPFGFREVVGADGVTRLVAEDKRYGSVSVAGEGGVAPAAGSQAPQVSAIQLATDLQRFGGKVTSGYRDPAHNARVGGQPNSQHLGGQAIDVVMPNPQLKAQAKAYMEAMGYQVIDEGDHLHGQPPRGRQGPNPYASRPAEQQAGLTANAAEQGKIDAQVGNAPRIAGADAQIAAAKERAVVEAKAAGERENTVRTRAVNANDTLGLLDEADKLLPGATGSYAGAAIDAGARIFGRSTGGAQNAARLKAIGGQLTSKMPRMEGPQGVMDVQLYKEMAGDLANETMPVETRMAAAKEIRRLNEKYAGKQAAPGGKQVKRTGTQNGRKVVEYTDGTMAYAD